MTKRHFGTSKIRGFAVRLLASLMVVAMGANPLAHAAFVGNGAGTSSNPYKIYTCTQLQSVATGDLDANYVLTGNVDCSETASWNGGTGFSPIGTSGAPFTGSFDGQNFTITGLVINREAVDDQGLFGRATAAIIQNVRLTDGSQLGRSNNGSLVGYADNSAITNIHSTQSVTANTGAYTGGLVGRAENATIISQSSYNGTITANDISGGIVGRLGDGSVLDSFSKGTLNANNDVAGGIVGRAAAASLARSYSAMTINAGTVGMVGGLAGYIDDVDVVNSFAATTLNHTDTNTHAGAIGYQYDGTAASSITNVLYDAYLCDCSSGIDFGIGSGTDVSTGVNAGNAAPNYFKGNSTNHPFIDGPWNFTTFWLVVANDYPALRTGSNPVDADSDGVSSAIEEATPNSGDANGDGIVDSAQPNVTAVTSPVTGRYVAIASTCDSNTGVSVVGEQSNATTDAAFDYPLGVAQFSLNCSVGATATVTQTWFTDISPSAVVARKYNRATKTYQAIPGATVSQASIGGQSALRLTYQITDGGSLDEDGAANGVIVDPAGLAQAVIGVPNTGYGGSAHN